MRRVEFIEWKKNYGFDLQIGSMVKIKPSCEYYEYYDPQYEDQEYMVTSLYVDAGGLNIGINEGGSDSWLCSADGYRFDELEPILLANSGK